MLLGVCVFCHAKVDKIIVMGDWGPVPDNSKLSVGFLVLEMAEIHFHLNCFSIQLILSITD